MLLKNKEASKFSQNSSMGFSHNLLPISREVQNPSYDIVCGTS